MSVGNFSDRRLLLLVAEVVEALGAMRPPAYLQALLQELTGEDVRVAVLPGGSTLPRRVWFNSAGDALSGFICKGVGGPEALALVLGWQGEYQLGQARGRNWRYLAALEEEVAGGFASSFERAGCILLGGHSGGGAAASLVDTLVPQQPGTPRLVVTLGSPRAMRFDAAWGRAETRYIRCMGQGDAVPILPPYPGESPSVSLLVGLGNFNTHGPFQQGPGGMIVDAAGSLRASVVAAPGGTIPLADYIGWLTGVGGSTSGAHPIGAYQQRLRLQKTLETGGTGRDVGEAPIESFRQFETMVRRASLPVEAEARDTLLGVFAMALPKIQGQARLTAVTLQDGRGGVYWENRLIAAYTTKQQAEVAARRVTSALRFFARAEGIDAATFQEALGDFLTLGGQEGGGVTPPLSVV